MYVEDSEVEKEKSGMEKETKGRGGKVITLKNCH